MQRRPAVMLGLAAMAGMMLCVAAVASGFEQGATPHGDVVPGKALRITITGESMLTLVARNDEFFRAALGNATNGAPGNTLLNGAQEPGSGSGGDFWFDPWVSINFDFELAKKVNAILELETPFNVFGDAGGSNTDGTAGTTANGGSRRQLDVEQIYVDWHANEAIEFLFGVQDYRKDFAERNNPFLIDVSRCENPFLNPGITNGAGAVVDYGTPQASSSGFVGTQEAAGALMRFTPGATGATAPATTIDAFYFTLMETFRKNTDDAMFGVVAEHLWYVNSTKGRFGGTIFALQNDSDSFLWTFGGGGVLKTPAGLDVYGEAYGQWGQYIANAGPAAGTVPGSTRNLGTRDIQQEEAYAFYGGLRYNFQEHGTEQTARPYIDASYWEVSGDDDGDDSKNEAFVSLENNNDTIVVEDGYYGLDIDTNYRAIKVRGGFEPARAWTIELLYAYFELQDNNGTADNTPASHDKIGDEFDVNVRYRATDYLTFRFGTGWLFNPQAIGLGEDINVTLFQAQIDF